jgi:hypothetical protein
MFVAAKSTEITEPSFNETSNKRFCKVFARAVSYLAEASLMRPNKMESIPPA